MTDYNGVPKRPGHGPDHDTSLSRAVYWMDQWLPPLPSAVREAMAHDLARLLDAQEADGFHTAAGILLREGKGDIAMHLSNVRDDLLRAKWTPEPTGDDR